MGYLSVLSFPTFFKRHLSGNIQSKVTCCIIIDIMTYLMIAANIVPKSGRTAGASIPGSQMPVLGGVAAVFYMDLCQVSKIIAYPFEIVADGWEIHIIQLDFLGYSVELGHTTALNVGINPYHYLFHRLPGYRLHCAVCPLCPI